MTGVLAVVPVIAKFTADISVPSMAAPTSSLGLAPDQVLLVDNSRDGFVQAGRYAKTGFGVYRDPDGHNLGVARSWNIGAKRVLNYGLDYLLIISSVMDFGPTLHTTWLEQMERFWGENVIECDGHSWHLLAIHRRVFEKVGLFDENFYPGYWEGLDFSFRMRQVGWEGGWTRCWVNAKSLGHALHLQVVDCPADPLKAYLEAKWGGEKHEETFSLPWGDQPLGYWPEHSIPELAEKYELRKWW